MPTPPDTRPYMVAAYIAAAVIYLGYAAWLYWRTRK
jgi:hypothetical protein